MSYDISYDNVCESGSCALIISVIAEFYAAMCALDT